MGESGAVLLYRLLMTDLWCVEVQFKHEGKVFGPFLTEGGADQFGRAWGGYQFVVKPLLPETELRPAVLPPNTPQSTAGTPLAGMRLAGRVFPAGYRVGYSASERRSSAWEMHDDPTV